MYRKSLLAILSCSFALLIPVTAASTATPQQPNTYVGADACKECHANYYQVWSGTKHSRALGRLTGGDREGGKCIRCHVTGSPEMIAADGAKPTLPNVQCEACHGAGGKHVGQAKAKAIEKGAIAKTPDEDACTRCHNNTSTHYKPFFYAALKGLVHPVKK